jgi:hypothetical protein
MMPGMHERIERLAGVQNVDVVPRGHIRIKTTFLYPDESSVDVFLVNNPDRLRLSDLGQTAMACAVTGRAVMDHATTSGVERVGGTLEKEVDDTDESIASGISVLARACVSMAELADGNRKQRRARAARARSRR